MLWLTARGGNSDDVSKVVFDGGRSQHPSGANDYHPSVREEEAYEILGLAPGATQADIDAAFRRISKAVHSDRGGSDALFRKVKEAHETLTSKARATSRGSSTKSDATSSGREGTDSSGSSTRYDEGPSSTEAKAGTTRAAYSEKTGFTGWLSRHPSLALVLGSYVLVGVAGRSEALRDIGLIGLVAGVAGLVGGWRVRRVERLRRSNMAAVDAMDGKEFERFLVGVFELEGYAVRHVGGRGDFGADLVITLNNVRTVVQAKRLSSVVGPGAVQEVVAAKAHYGATRAIVVTNSTFTPAAKLLAKSNHVDLWPRERLAGLLASQSTIPPTRGGALLAQQLRYGVPLFLGAIALVVVGAVSNVASSGKKVRRRRTRWRW